MKGEQQNIKIELIDDPEVAMRSQMDDEKLSELCGSIRTFGLISPLVVRPVGKRFEVIAGHRRLKALQLLREKLVPCIVRNETEHNAAHLKMHENLYREDINPVDEAAYMHEMMTTHKMSMDEMVAGTGKRKEYIQGRLDLMVYPEYLLKAVYEESITLAVASWLVRIDNENVRKEYTRFACATGISAATARDWYDKYKLGSLPTESANYIPPEVTESGMAKPLEMPCIICGHQEDVAFLEMHYAHGTCKAEMQKVHRENDRLAQRAQPEGVDA